MRFRGRSVWPSPLRSPDDSGVDQPEKFQAAVRLILDKLSKIAPEGDGFHDRQPPRRGGRAQSPPGAIAAEDRPAVRQHWRPGLGHATGRGDEYNVGLDRNAYVCIMRSDLPVYWCPCFDGKLWERGRHGTFWKFAQADVLERLRSARAKLFHLCPDEARFALIRCSTCTTTQDVKARETVWRMTRNMWCTAPFFHAAGRNVLCTGCRRLDCPVAGQGGTGRFVRRDG